MPVSPNLGCFGSSNRGRGKQMHNVGVSLVVALALSAVLLVAAAQPRCSDATRWIEAAAKQRQ
jgi:hypothetical protein